MTPSLYRPEFEHDSCGFGLIAQIDDRASHTLLRDALTALDRLSHRGGVGADGRTGDGCGVLLKFPANFLRAVAADAGIVPGERFAAGLVFLSRDDALADAARDALADELKQRDLRVAGWRTVPTDATACGEASLATLPRIEQVFVDAPDALDPLYFESRLLAARRCASRRLADCDPMFYVVGLSARTLGYKAMVLASALPAFYPDLRDPRLATSVCVFHQRYSTNTEPQWRLAQPFRLLAHNGEINAIQGNRNWALARGALYHSPLIDSMDDLLPMVNMSGSDSSSLDNMLEVLLAGGIDLFRALRMMIPPAWQNVEGMDPDLRAFYEYHALHMEPWDGPAGIVLCDGRHAACILDRNGLRPARWTLTTDRRLIVASETGVVDLMPGDIAARGRLGPGQMLAVDLDRHQVLYPDDIDADLKSRRPYRQWLQDHSRYLEPARIDEPPVCDPLPPDRLLAQQALFGVTEEERERILRPMAELGHEAVGSMGDDTPMAVLSHRPRSLYDHFRQQFAQVTNPPIDPLREGVVMSLVGCLGSEGNLFAEDATLAERIVVESPLLSERQFRALHALDPARYPLHRIELSRTPDETLEAALSRLGDWAEDAARAGRVLLVLSDRGIGPERLPVHALLALGAIHQRLVRERLRCRTNLIVDTGTARDAHQIAVLIGFGASLVRPWLAFEILDDLTRGHGPEAAARAALNYRRSIEKGLYKIMSKMGICTVDSYRAAQLFEIVGLSDKVVTQCFAGAPSRIGGASYRNLDDDQRDLHAAAWATPARPLPHGGLLQHHRDGEYHAYNPDVVADLQRAVASGDTGDYRRFAHGVNERPAACLRDLLVLRLAERPLSLDEVEPAAAILARFDSAAMSLGALSPEAHETLAEAMNRIGGRSNSGEGGEDPARYGTTRRSRIKQIASGRFGVTPGYLADADVLQIKIAQGAKPGEGGQLPGSKVNALIARLRFARPGVALISPPPHHDIYSIEDLAQLIFDLRQINPRADVSVKLVASAGVGTIAAGVAKAGADLITIAGHDGGTGASPLTSVKYAGAPWELGLAEAQQTLIRNGLRDRVRLQADGGLKTGLDVVKAALLGADSFGFGTAPMIAMGCKYLRICHLNNCATGVATQHEALRELHFRGDVERVVRYFRFVADEVREWLAALGAECLDDIIGRTDRLDILPGETPRQRRLDLRPLLARECRPLDSMRHGCAAAPRATVASALAARIAADTEALIATGRGGRFDYRIGNVDRAIGAAVSGAIARRFGDAGLPGSTLHLRFDGSAGQSFGAWNAPGLQLELMGDANDYVGKGMAGGQIAIRPPDGVGFAAHEAALIGNTCLYGATGGRLFAAGRAGERFAVRNSGATAVVEGCGDHGCEYMTNGVVLVLGPTGLNFGAGMTGGFAIVLDESRGFVDCCNHELVDMHRIDTEAMTAQREFLRELLDEHIAATGSAFAQAVRSDFRRYAGRFWLIKPKAADLDSLLEQLQEAA